MNVNGDGRCVYCLPLKSRPPPSPNGVGHILLLLLLSAATRYAAAQSTSDPSSSQYPYADLNPSMAIVAIVFVVIFFFIGLMTLYIRQCAESAAAQASPRRYPAARFWRVPRGLDPSVVESFPIFGYAEVKDHKIGKDELKCTVCINEFEDGEMLRLLPKCDHVFHPECIGAWLASHTTCPVCRADLSEDSGKSPSGGTLTSEPNLEAIDSNFRGEVRETQNQVSINVDVDGSQQKGSSQTSERANGGENLKQGKGRVFEKLPRSHSTGHSLVQPGECTTRYTLRLPGEVRAQLMSRKMKRVRSCVAFSPRDEGSSRRGYRSGGEGSNRGRSDRIGKSDRWVLSMAAPFFWRAGSVAPVKAAEDAGSTAGSSFKSFSKAPFDCIAVKGDGDTGPPARAPG